MSDTDSFKPPVARPSSSSHHSHPRLFHLNHKTRRTLAVIVLLIITGGWLIINPKSYETEIIPDTTAARTSDFNNSASNTQSEPFDSLNPPSNTSASSIENSDTLLATAALEKLEIKGRAPKTGYARTEFYNNWPNIDGCSLRQRIIKRDFGDTAKTSTTDTCTIISGEYNEPYTGQHVVFTEKSQISKQVQIDHIVALSDAWQKGAQYFDKDTRYQIATDPLNLIAADANANQTKSDGDAATWLPSNKAFRCQYVARQVSVKYKYHLWLTQAEHDAIAGVLAQCPNEPTVGIKQ